MRWGISFAFVLVAIPTYSQSDDILDYSLEELLKLRVTTASKQEESVATAPSDILVVTRKQIQERGYRNLEDLLKDLPSVDVHTQSSSTSYNNIALRGIFGNSKFVILQDGLRISSPTGEDIPVSYNFPLHHVKQVEFIFGPASALYGADAMSGIINLITLSTLNESEQFVSMSFGQKNHRHYSGLFNTSLIKDDRLVVGFHRQRTDGPDLASTYPQTYVLGDLITLGGVIAVQLEDREPSEFPQDSYSAFAKWTYGDTKLGLNRSVILHSTATGTRPNTVDYGKEPFWQTEIDNFYLQTSWQVSENLKTSLRLDYSAYHIDEDSKFANIFVDFGNGYKYAEGIKHALTQQFNWQITNNQSLVLGYAYQDFDTIPKTADLLEPFDDSLSVEEQQLVYPFVGDLPVKIFNIKWQNKSIFAQHQAKLNEQYTTTLGVRYDNSSNYGSTINPRIGVVYSNHKDSIFKVLYGEAFIAPTPRFTHDHFGAFAFQRNDGLYQSFFMQIPNTALKPEESKTLEINYQKTMSPNFNIRATAYSTKVDNLIDRVITEIPVSDFIPGGFISTTQIFDNVGEIDVSGADFRLNWQKQFNESSLSLATSYSYVEGNLKKLTNKINVPFAAPNKLKLNMTYRTGNWVISPSLQWYDETPNNAGEKADDYLVVDLYSYYRFKNAPFKISLRVNNLLDKKYRVAAESNLGVLESVPQPERQFILHFDYLF
ncbi:MAG: TonB-dependent receptor [Kangiellaceae bacterium]|nr:TonB-dependent receptor [Kangiellaceae bacterium]